MHSKECSTKEKDPVNKRDSIQWCSRGSMLTKWKPNNWLCLLIFPKAYFEMLTTLFTRTSFENLSNLLSHVWTEHKTTTCALVELFFSFCKEFKIMKVALQRFLLFSSVEWMDSASMSSKDPYERYSSGWGCAYSQLSLWYTYFDGKNYRRNSGSRNAEK